MWRFAEKTIGRKATFKKLTEVINHKLQTLGHPFHLSKQNLIEFLKKYKGTPKSERFVPILSDEKKQQRMAWVEWKEQKVQELGNKFYYCFIDQIWFYLCSGRCMEKVTKAAEFEKEEDTYIQNTAIPSKRHI